jgi:uncharacterized protein (DUF885 family)
MRVLLGRTLLCGLWSVLLAVPALAQTGDPRFTRLGEEFLEHWLSRNPHVATRLGVHDWDDLLLPVTEASLAEEAVWLRDFRGRLGAVSRSSLSFGRALEYDVLKARIERQLLDVEAIRPFENNPNAYLELVAGSIQSLLQHDFAPLCQRLRPVIHRLVLVPEVLRAARVNLRDPPHIFTEVAITQFQGAVRFYREELPAAAAGCKDARTQADLSEAIEVAARATESFIAFLKDDLLPRSNGSFALGRDLYQKKLACEEMETTPVESLLARGWRALDETQGRMEAVAERIAPGQGVRAALDSLDRDAPTDRELVPFVASQLDSIRAFLRARDIITPPPRENLIVREAPAFRRSLSFASMSSPGVWEKRATEAYYNVTPVEPGWTEQQKHDHLAFFNRYASAIISIHEALPGHYYQFLALRKVPSRLRQALSAGSNTEGWAHYCEQMAIEEGFGAGDPRFELAQLALAIRRIGRFIVGISLHTQGMTYEDAVKLFEERCYMAAINAEREARRGTSDPTYLVYTLGKWRILELREEVRRGLGNRYRPRLFHDAFLKQGGSPLPVVRAALLRDLGLDGGGRGSRAVR